MVSLSKATSLSLTSFSGALPSFIFTASAVSRASGGLYAGSRLNISPKRASRSRPSLIAMSEPRGSPTPCAPLAARPLCSLASAAGGAVVGVGVGTGAGTTGAADAGAIPASTGTTARPAAPASTRRRDTDVSATVAAPPLNGHAAIPPPLPQPGPGRLGNLGKAWDHDLERSSRVGGVPGPRIWGTDRPQCGRAHRLAW